ncbi:MAG: molybdopterin-dependent oxidoreductase [Bdellovibrionales bacterium]|nr:molybdopterin-dependent oxidoreductase [Bdellovibrionales bacterium]
MAAKKIDSLNIIGQTNSEALSKDSGMSRRDFLKISGASAAVTAIGCADPATQNIIPYLKGDDKKIPGVATWYASTCTECPAGCGIQIKTREGRAIKIEGNKENPINRGGLCAQGQASLQGLYDPDRVRQPLERVADEKGRVQFKPISWKSAFSKIKKSLAKNKKQTALLTGNVGSSLQALINEWGTEANIKHVVFEPGDHNALAKAASLAYGVEGVPGYRFEKADFVLNFGADFLESWISPVEFARAWAEGRKHNKLKLVHVEPRLSLTGANSDKWLRSKPGAEILIAQAILKNILDRGLGENLDTGVREQIQRTVSKVTTAEAARSSGVSESDILLTTEYLVNAKAPLVIAGGAAASTSNAVELQLISAFLNLVLGSVGKTVDLGSVRKVSSSPKSITSLVNDMRSQKIGALFIYGTNPIFTLSQELAFDYASKIVPLVVSFSSHLDDTARAANLILPANTSIESWGDFNPVEGIYSLQQPAMTPVFDTMHVGDMLLKIARDSGNAAVGAGAEDFHSYLKESWKQVHSNSGRGGSFEKFWLSSVENGGWFKKQTGSAVKVKVDPEAFRRDFKKASFNGKGLIVYPYSSVKSFNGSSANKPWLQELPDPMTHVSWSSWAEMHPETAKDLGVKQGDPVTLRNNTGEITVPAYVTEHVCPEIVAVPVGQGHKAYGRFAQRVASANVYSLISNKTTKDDHLPLLSTKAIASKAMGRPLFTVMQGSFDQGEREIAQTEYRSSSSSEKAKKEHEAGHDEHQAHGSHHAPKQMYKQREHPLYRWAMAIDLESCTGCSACVVACYAENNISTVGPEHVAQGREMSWIRIERYMDKNPSQELKVSFIPMMCQHCNSAPCEPVCPVYATYHNEEGLNAMVYNRCVGTRYCGNNCSYKVRRYNWFEYEWPEPLNWQINPDVTKRTAGVMEKCTFCVQRINEAKDRAKDIGRPVLDGEVQPACVQSCPTQALSFGNLNDSNSQVAKAGHDSRAYKVLDHHINTQPSVTYLKDVRYKI